MRELITVDAFRHRKDILWKVALIVIAVIAVMNGGIFFLAKVLTDEEEFLQLLCGRSMFGSGYSISGNVGLLTVLFAGVIVCKDFSMGTIRNKMIRGYSRDKIFLSGLLVNCVAVVLFVTINVLVLFGAITLALGYGAPFDLAELGEMCKIVLCGTMLYLAMSALVTLLAFSTQSTVMTIVIYIAIILGMDIVYVTLQTMVNLGTLPEVFGKIVGLLPSQQCMELVEIGTLGAKDVLRIVLANAIYTVVFAGMGLMIFRKRDVK